MEYQKTINLLENTSNQSTEFRTKNRVEMNNDLRVTYNTNSQIKFRTLMLRSSIYDYSDAYILVSGTIAITGAWNNDTARQLDEKKNKGVIFKNFATLTDCISETNNTQIDKAKYIDNVMLRYNLLEYGDNCSKASEN